jgi:transposase
MHDTGVRLAEMASLTLTQPNLTDGSAHILGIGHAGLVGMSKHLVPDDLCARIEPLLPKERPQPKGGQPRIPDRASLTGIIFVLKSGIPWELLPQEMGFGAGMTCWRRRDWQEAGVWGRLHWALLDELGEADQIDWSRSGVDSASIPAKRGSNTGPDPSDRGQPGTKRHDSTMFAELVHAIRPIRRPGKRPVKVHADKGCDYRHCRQALTQRRITIRIARNGIESRQKLGQHRWVVERTMAWLNRFLRLTVRLERRADIHQAFLTLGCSLLCFNANHRFCHEFLTGEAAVIADGGQLSGPGNTGQAAVRQSTRVLGEIQPLHILRRLEHDVGRPRPGDRLRQIGAMGLEERLLAPSEHRQSSRAVSRERGWAGSGAMRGISFAFYGYHDSSAV